MKAGNKIKSLNLFYASHGRENQTLNFAFDLDESVKKQPFEKLTVEQASEQPFGFRDRLLLR